MRGNMHAALGAAIGTVVMTTTQNYDAGIVFLGCCMI